MSSAKRSVAIIDADQVLYSKATMAEVAVGEDEWFQLMSPEQAYTQVIHVIEEMTETVRCETALVCLSDSSSNCFRKNLYPPYKENRKGKRRPALLEPLRQMVLSSEEWYGKLAIKNLEADDVCGITTGIMKDQGRRAVVVSYDKDLMTVPGKVWDPKPTKGGRQREIVDVTEEDADRAFFKQTLTGDTADNYPGCPGIGPVKADAALDNCYSQLDMWEAVVECFESKGLTEEDALVQARLSRILRKSDWDAKKKEVLLWTPPTKQ